MTPADVAICDEFLLDGRLPVGFRVVTYEAPCIRSVAVSSDRLAEGFEALIAAMQERAAEVSCNAIMAVEFDLDPFGQEGCSMSCRGTPVLVGGVQ